MRTIALLCSLLLTGAVGAESDAQAASAPDLVAQRCQQCHGEDGASAIPGWPALAELSTAEFTGKLLGYRSQQLPESVMARAAHDLTDTEIEQLAAYYAILGQ